MNDIKAITDFLFIEDELEDIKKSDLVLVLCNDSIKDICEKIHYLIEKGKASGKIIISGCSGILDQDKDKECYRVCNMLCDEYGYERSRFILEVNAKNIYENLAFSKKYVLDEDVNNIVVIGAAFALRRIKLTANKLGYPTNKMQFVGTIDERKISKDSWWKTDVAKERVYAEIERIGKYLIKGDLDIK